MHAGTEIDPFRKEDESLNRAYVRSGFLHLYFWGRSWQHASLGWCVNDSSHWQAGLWCYWVNISSGQIPNTALLAIMNCIGIHIRAQALVVHNAPRPSDHIHGAFGEPSLTPSASSTMGTVGWILIAVADLSRGVFVQRHRPHCHLSSSPQLSIYISAPKVESGIPLHHGRQPSQHLPGRTTSFWFLSLKRIDPPNNISLTSVRVIAFPQKQPLCG